MRKAIFICSVVLLASGSVLAAEPTSPPGPGGTCDSIVAIPKTSPPAFGRTYKHITQRCISIDADKGVALTCDIDERAVSSSCFLIDKASGELAETYLTSSGRVGFRSAACEWSGNVRAASGGPWTGLTALP